MEKNSQNGKVAQGATVPNPLTEAQVQEYVKKDLAVCINLLDAIYQDQATIEIIASVLYGRFMNAKHKEDLAKQTELGVS